MINAPSINELFSLEGKNTFITGSTAGFGLIVAASFAKSGARVTIAGRRNAQDKARSAPGTSSWMHAIPTPTSARFRRSTVKFGKEILHFKGKERGR